ncbi:MAG TPA: FtsX-like permease family protein, partial [Chryseolinea sp.]|nr:FtsX-like permease family protein [Chryseolinea sp.]
MNQFKIATRNILKQKAYNALNAIGLATGIACGLIIALYIKEELSYEKSFPSSENIYRAHMNEWAKSSPPMSSLMRDFFPEIETIGRFANYGTHVVSSDDSAPIECSGYYADSTILDVFDFKILSGNRSQALATKGSIVITESLARKFFGDADPIGKTLAFDEDWTLTVNAVMQDVPENSHLKFDFLAPIKDREWGDSRNWMVMYTYAKFKSAEGFSKADARMPDFLRNYYSNESADDMSRILEERAIRFQPLEDIHLRSDLEQEMGPNGKIVNIYIFMAVEFLILIIACANFMSLFTTQAIKRMKEVGMRKILGAKPKQLMWQFFVEVILLAIFSLVLAIVIYQLVLPFYNSLAGRSLQPWQIFEGDNLIIMGLILLIIILTSGLYPAIFITQFKSASFLRSGSLPRSFPNVVRSGLVVFQFMISSFLIASTIIVHQQMSLIHEKELGFDKDQILYIKLYGKLYQKAVRESQVFRN